MILLHILLFLLKLVGIVLLVILGLIVLMLTVVLFTPVRYRIGASKYQSIQAEGRVTWLFRLIELLFQLDTGAEEGNHLHLSFRIAWHKLYDNQKPKEKRIKPKKSRKTKSERKTEQEEAKIPPSQPRQGDPEAYSTGSRQGEQERQLLNSQQTAEKKDEIPKLIQPEMPKAAQQDKASYEAESGGENADAWLEGSEESVFEKVFRLVKSFAGKVLALIRGIFSMLCGVLKIPSKIMNGIEKLEQLFTRIREKKEAFLAFYYEEHNHQWFTAFWQRLKKLLLKILPRPDKLYLHFGFDDPAATGQVLGGLSILYPLCGDKMDLRPEFNEEVLEGEVRFHGSIRPVVLVIFAAKSFLNKQFFAIVKQFKGLVRGE